MADKDIKNEELAAMQEDAEEVQVVVLTDDNGNEAYFMEEMIIPYEGKSFAVLVSIDEDCCEDEDCDCHHHHEEEDEDDYCIIARIDFDENGEAVYVLPPMKNTKPLLSCTTNIATKKNKKHRTSVRYFYVDADR